MKPINFLKIVAVFCLFTFSNQIANAQFFDKLKDKVTQKVEDKILNKVDETTDQGMDSLIDGVTKKKKTPTKKDGTKKQQDKLEGDDGSDTDKTNVPVKGSLISYANYDFVPGDKIIFQYDMAGEKDAEIPGRMLVDGGNAEIQTYKGEKVLFIPAGEAGVFISPFMKEKSYLPNQYTIEFDVLANGGLESTYDASDISLYFRTKDDQLGSYGNYSSVPLKVLLSGISGKDKTPQYMFTVSKEGGESVGYGYKDFPSQAINPKQDNWRRVSIYVNENISKLYMDQYRIGIMNQIEPGRIVKLEIQVKSSENPVLFRNFRIAAGGSDFYNKVITDGKFIAYGIQFDVNKSLLKPESMGTINEFVKMMKENADLKFEIGGHTDTDGTLDRNNVLSQERADAVKKQMIGMGIDPSRLTTKGYGSSKSIIDNSTAENKARNRRVEFVKMP